MLFLTQIVTVADNLHFMNHQETSKKLIYCSFWKKKVTYILDGIRMSIKSKLIFFWWTVPLNVEFTSSEDTVQKGY